MRRLLSKVRVLLAAYAFLCASSGWFLAFGESCNNTGSYNGGGTYSGQAVTKEPVNLGNGNMSLQYQDISIPSYGPSLNLKRIYNNQCCGHFENFKPQWAQSGTWNIENNELSGKGGRLHTKKVYTDFTFETDMKTVTAGNTDWRTSWLDFRYQDLGNYYYFLIDKNGRLDLSKYKNGTLSHLVYKSTTYSPMDWHRIKLDVQGNRIQIYIDNNQEIDYTDLSDTIDTGEIGFNTANYCHAHYDNVVLNGDSVFSSDFNGASGWDQTTGDWAIESQEYSGHDGQSLTQTTWQDFTFTADIKTLEPGINSWDTAWIDFCYIDDQNYYYCLIHTNGLLELSKIQNGQSSILMEKPSTFNPSDWNNIRVVTDSSTINVYVNDSLQIQYTDTQPLNVGKVGLEAHSSHAHFDNTIVHDHFNGLKNDFNSADAWEQVLGTWDTANGTYNGDTGRVLTHQAWNDFVLDLDMQTTESTGDPWDTAWVDFRYTDPNNQYYFLMKKDGQIELSKIKDGQHTFPILQLAADEVTDNNLALGCQTTASSGNGNAATDGDTTSRWSSDASDPQWITVDLGTIKPVSKVTLRWETAFGQSYKIQVSTDNATWTDVYNTTSGQGGVENIPFAQVNARFVRMYGIARGTQWGYSLWEFQVYGGNLAQGCPATASSGNGSAATDGNTSTRWSSNASDSQWITVDLGTIRPINEVVLNWETAYGKSYKIQVSQNNTDWTDVYTTTYGQGGVETLHFSQTNARYVRMYGTERGTQWGYSLWEFQVNLVTSNLALKCPTTTSSGDGNAATDGSTSTRWSTDASDPQWITVDLGAIKPVNEVVLNWEAAYGKSYRIQVSSDNINWADVYSTTSGQGGVETIQFSQVNARFVRMYGTERGTQWGYSLWEFGVYHTKYDPSAWNHIQISAHGPTIQVSINGNKEIDYTDTDPLLSGKIGLEAFLCKSSFDNVEVNYTTSISDNFNRDTTGLFGFGWTSTYDSRIEEFSDGTLLMYRADGGIDEYTTDYQGSYIPPKGIYNTLTKSTTGYTLQTHRGIVYTFGSDGKILSVTDSNNNTLSMSYSAGQLVNATDASGRHLTFTYDTNNKIKTITDPAGHTFHYEYDQNDQLNKVTNPLGKSMTYEYDPITRNMLSDSDYSGNTFSTEYLYNDKVCKQTDPLGNETFFTYAWDLRIATNSLNQAFLWKFGNDDCIQSHTDPNGNIEYYGWDANHNKVSYTDKNGNTTKYAYDERGNCTAVYYVDGSSNSFTYEPVFNKMTSKTVPSGAGLVTTFYQYDQNGNLTQITDPKGYTTTYTYDQHGKALSMVNPRGSTTTYTYDSYGNLATITDALGNMAQYSYDILGNKTSSTDPDGNVTSNQYDTLSRLTKIIDAEENAIEKTYDDNNNLISVKDRNDNITNFSYNAVGNLVATTNAQENTTQYTYDSTDYMLEMQSNKTNTLDALNNVSTSTYDGAHHLISQINSNGKVTRYTYDGVGNMLIIVDPLGNSTTNTYDNRNRLVSVVDAEGNTINYTYDSAGNKTAVTDEKGHTTYATYDELNRITTVTDPLGHSNVYTYDEMGNVRTQTDANGNLIECSYDNLNRLATKLLPDNTVQYTYDAEGHLSSVSNNESIITYAYDTLGRTTSSTQTFKSDNFSKCISYTYDANGNKLTAGNNLYTYDSLNRLTTITYSTQVFTFTYDALDRRTALTYPNGVSSSYTYDNISQLISLTHTLPGPITLPYSYTYDDVGNRISMTDSLGTHSFVYNKKYHLISAQHPSGFPMPLAESFNYDPSGNRTSSHLSLNYTNDDANQLNEDSNYCYTYDLNGNLISKTEKATNKYHKFTYNSENKLIEYDLYNDSESITPIVTASYKYDGLGNRIEKNVDGATTRFVYDGNNMCLEIDGNNNTRATYIYGPNPDEPLAMLRNDTWYYYHADGLGSIIAITDNSASIIERYYYDTFGRLIIKDERGNTLQQSVVGNYYTYTAREYDIESGLYFYRARYYDSSTGRFINRDPKGMVDGPNKYTYVKNNPLCLKDPTGYCASSSGLPFYAYASGKDVVYQYNDCTTEIWSGGTRSWRNNNPGNLKDGAFTTNEGAIGNAGGFAVFASYQAGFQAMVDLLNTDNYQDGTISEAIAAWAPPSENDTAAYQKFIASSTGLDINSPMNNLTSQQINSLATAIQQYEGYQPGTISKPSEDETTNNSDSTNVGSGGMSGGNDITNIFVAIVVILAIF